MDTIVMSRENNGENNRESKDILSRDISLDILNLNSALRNAFVNNCTYHGNRVYSVNDNILAKHAREDHNLDILISEYQIGKRLFDAGISVPKFYNITWLRPEKLNYDEGIIKKIFLGISTVSSDRNIFYSGNWFLLKNKLDGEELTFLSQGRRSEAKNLLRKELYKVLDLGICPDRDALYCGNSLFNRDTNKISLIDFEGWHDGEKWEINRFAEILRGPIFMSGLFDRRIYFMSKMRV
jgi:hypothetical protein